MRYYDDGLVLEHSGIKGQKWGIRRYQYEDGSLTEAGKKRYTKTIYSYTKNKERSDKYTAKANKYKYKAGTWVARMGNGNLGQRRLLKAAKNERKALKATTKADKAKSRLSNYMKKNNLTIDQIRAALDLNATDYERLKVMFA